MISGIDRFRKFGELEAKSNNTLYTASVDGFIIASGAVNYSAVVSITVDAVVVAQSDNYDNSNPKTRAMSAPVAKGKQYITAGATAVYFMPSNLAVIE